MTRLDALIEKSLAAGMFGTKMRSVIKSANAQGIAAVVAQQFEYGNRIADAGLMPILEPEYDITAPDRADGEEILLAEIMKHLDALPAARKVMLKLSIPVAPNHYALAIAHPKVLRVVALSGGYSTDEACAKLAKNKGMIASFSRGLLQDLRKDQDDEEFDAVLGAAIDRIQAASIAG
jgi:fructose-bisphosphate aldolase class I